MRTGSTKEGEEHRLNELITDFQEYLTGILLKDWNQLVKNSSKIFVS